MILKSNFNTDSKKTNDWNFMTGIVIFEVVKESLAL